MSNAVKASLLRAKSMYTSFVAGAPAVDGSTLEVSGGVTLRVKAGGIAANELATATIVYGKMAAADKASHGVMIGQVRGPTGLVTTATLGAGVFAEVVASNVHRLGGELADGNTKTSVGTFQFQLPKDFVAAGDVVVRVTTMLKSVTGTGVANNGSDVDISAYEQSKTAGTVGSDICETAAQTYAALDTMYQKDFVITATGLVAGDLLNILLTCRAIENDAGNGSLQSIISGVEVLCDVYGSAA